MIKLEKQKRERWGGEESDYTNHTRFQRLYSLLCRVWFLGIMMWRRKK
jgi:hypothetical protein